MRRLASVFVALLVACLPACRGEGPRGAPDGREFPHVTDTIDRHAPTMEQLARFTYSGIGGATVTLANGAWRANEGDANSQQVRLIGSFRLTGDITGNGTDEAVVLLESRQPPAAAQTYLAVVGWIGGQLLNLANTPISDRVEVRGGHIEPRHIILDVVPRGADASTRPAPITYLLEGNTLRLTSGDPAAVAAPATAPAAEPLSEAPLAGTIWRLVQFRSMNGTTATPEPAAPYVLSFSQAGTLTVRADCNRGRGSWRSPDSGTLELGPLTMSRASCQSTIYRRFVGDIGRVRSYVIKNGRLYLSLKTGAGTYEFAPLKPADAG